MTVGKTGYEHSSERGFTIVELMIATMVFSLILTIITAGVISFTTRYYKGVNTSTTQTTARSILDTISQSIQFGTSDITTTEPGVKDYFCAGGYNFSFDKGTKYTGTELGLYMSPETSGLCAKMSSPPTGGKQLLGKNMRLTTLEVEDVSTNVYKITLGVAYGDDDLLCSPSVNNCNNNTALINFGQSDIQCKSSTGTQFCAVSKLTTVVARRVAP